MRMKRINCWVRLATAALPVVAMAFTAASCTDNEMMDNSQRFGKGLSFTVSQQANDQWQTRAAQESTGRHAVVQMQQEGEGNTLYLHSYSEPMPAYQPGALQTRGIPVADSLNNFLTEHEAFGVFGYQYPGDSISDWTNDVTPNYAYNMRIGHQSGDVWAPDGTYYLPGAGYRVRFFAYAPYVAESEWGTNGIEFSGRNAPAGNGTWSPVLTYTVPALATDQVDMMAAGRGNDINGNPPGTDIAGGTLNASIPLEFTHMLAAIRLETAGAGAFPEGTITGIRINGAYYKGTAPLVNVIERLQADRSTDRGGTYPYSYRARSGAAVMTFGAGGSEANVNLLREISGTRNDSQVFFVLPQRFKGNTNYADNDGTENNEARLEILFQQPGESQSTIYSAKIADLSDNWLAGRLYTYKVSLDVEEEPELTITANNGTTINQYNGGDLSFTVTSRRGSQPVEYSLQFSTDGGNTWVENTATTKPGMIGNTPKTSTGNGVWRHTVHINRATLWVNGADARTLQQAQWQTDKNLASDGNSANCYIVNEPGRQHFPAVYGNSLRNGQVNRDVAPYSNPKYVDGRNVSITADNMWMPDPITVRVLWQDVDGLVRVEGVQGTGRSKRVYIVVGGSEAVKNQLMQPGNALLGAFSGNQLIWSWHIWVTPWPSNSTLGNGGTIRFMNRPLGSVQGGRTTATPRSCMMRAVAIGEDGQPYYSTTTITLNQIPNDFSATNLPGRYPTYQWGRKEPMWPATTEAGHSTNGMLLYGPYAPTSIQTRSLDTRAARIANPTVFNTNDGGFDANLWNAGASSSSSATTTGAVTKSMYDPCPAGWHVPQSDAFVTGILNDRATSGRANRPDEQYGSLDTNESAFTFNNGGVRVALSGARFHDSNPAFSFSNNASEIYYGGSWTAGRQNLAGGNLSSVLCLFEWIRYPWIAWGQDGSVEIQPQMGRYVNGTAGGTSHPLNCWPIIPQAD